MPNAATAIKPYPIHLAESSEVPEIVYPQLSKAVRFGLYIGTLMTASPPKNWTWNPSVVTLLILIASIIGGGAYYMGRQATIIENIQQQVIEAKQKADAAMSIANPGAEETPTPTPLKGAIKK